MGDILQNISIIVASVTAVYGVISWRREHIGKKKIDLAEEVLCSIYEIKDIIRFIRSPLGFEGEGSTRKRGSNENQEESRILDNAYVVYERYNKHKDVFNNFLKLQYRYMANFGKKGEEPFKIISKVINDIFSASRMLARVYWRKLDRETMSETELSRHLEKIQKYENIFWQTEQEDEINNQIESAIRVCEDICKSANNLGIWNFLKRYR